MRQCRRLCRECVEINLSIVAVQSLFSRPDYFNKLIDDGELNHRRSGDGKTGMVTEWLASAWERCYWRKCRLITQSGSEMQLPNLVRRASRQRHGRCSRNARTLERVTAWKHRARETNARLAHWSMFKSYRLSSLSLSLALCRVKFMAHNIITSNRPRFHSRRGIRARPAYTADWRKSAIFTRPRRNLRAKIKLSAAAACSRANVYTKRA